MVDDSFIIRCKLCEHEIEVEWGPETHSTAERIMLEHIEAHTDREMRDYAQHLLMVSFWAHLHTVQWKAAHG